MPGKSKEGGGLETTPVYKKSAFTMRSGNSPLFKMMGSSPIKDDTKPPEIKTHDASGKRIISKSQEQTLIDKQLLAKANDPTKHKGSGATEADYEATKRAARRQAVLSTRKGGKHGSRKQLKEWAKGSKLRKFFTSTKKLRSEATSAQLREAIDVDKQVASRDEAKSRGY